MTIFRLGKIQRRVWRAFVANPGAELTTADLVAVAFTRLPPGEIKNKHRLSTRLAARAVAVCVGHKRRSGGLIWVAKPMQDQEMSQ